MIPNDWIRASARLEFILVIAFMLSAFTVFLLTHTKANTTLVAICYFISQVTSVLLILGAYALAFILVMNLLGSVAYG